MPPDRPEFGELVAALQEHGLLQPIVRHDGRILDGRNRYRASKPGGIVTRFEESCGDSPRTRSSSLVNEEAGHSISD